MEQPEDTAATGLGATKRCDYCGRKSASAAAFCDGCGTPFAFPPPLPPLAVLGSSSLPAHAAKPPPLPVQTGLLDARSATTILLLTIAAQVVVALVISFLAGFAAAFNLHGTGVAHVRNATTAIITRLTPVTVTAAYFASVVTVLAASWTSVPRALKDRSSAGAAWVPGSLRHLASGLGLGVVVALMMLGLMSIPALRPTHIHLGPLARMSNTPGWPRMLWLVLVVLLAPPTEELLFRGVVYGGYCRSFGPAKAAVLTTSIFWVLHLTEIARLPIGGVGIAGAAIAALWMRVRSSAVGPAIATHFGYNGTLALLHVLSIHPHA